MITKEKTNNFKDLDTKLELIPLTYDFAFKTVFASNLDILRDFLITVMPLEVKNDCDIKLLNSELPKENKNEYKKIIDMYITLDNKIDIDIEINRMHFGVIKTRNIIYFAKLLSMLLESGESILSLKDRQVNQLWLNACENESEYNDEVVTLYALNSKKVFSDVGQMFIKNLAYFRKLYYNQGERRKDVIWLTALTAKTFSELYELMKQVLEGSKLKRFMEAVVNMSRENFSLHGWQKERMDALVLECAKDYGRDEGREEGRTEGLNEGRAIGIHENKLETVKNMLKENIDIEVISRVTNLSLKDVKKLSKEC